MPCSWRSSSRTIRSLLGLTAQTAAVDFIDDHPAEAQGEEAAPGKVLGADCLAGAGHADEGEGAALRCCGHVTSICHTLG